MRSAFEKRIACRFCFYDREAGTFTEFQLFQFDVVICNELPNTELYRVHFPVRKKDAFEFDRQPRVRYKKNVRLVG